MRHDPSTHYICSGLSGRLEAKKSESNGFIERFLLDFPCNFKKNKKLYCAFGKTLRDTRYARSSGRTRLGEIVRRISTIIDFALI